MSSGKYNMGTKNEGKMSKDTQRWSEGSNQP